MARALTHAPRRRTLAPLNAAARRRWRQTSSLRAHARPRRADGEARVQRSLLNRLRGAAPHSAAPRNAHHDLSPLPTTPSPALREKSAQQPTWWRDWRPRFTLVGRRRGEASAVSNASAPCALGAEIRGGRAPRADAPMLARARLTPAPSPTFSYPT